MAVHIRLTRKGRKKQPFYRIIVANSQSSRDGKFLDILGTYDPMREPAAVQIDTEKLAQWTEKGAIPSVTVRSLKTGEAYEEPYDKLLLSMGLANTASLCMYVAADLLVPTWQPIRWAQIAALILFGFTYGYA